MLARPGRQRRPTSSLSYRLDAGAWAADNVGAELGMKAITRNARHCAEPTNVGFAQNSHRCATVRPRAGGRRPLGLWAHPPGMAARSKKSPPRPEPGGRKRGRVMLRVDFVGAVPLVGFEGFDRNPHLLAKEAGNPAARGVFLPSGMGHDFGERRAALALQHCDDFLALGPGAGSLRLAGLPGLPRDLRLGFLRCLLALGRGLGGGGLLTSLALHRRGLGGLCATLGLLVGLRLLGLRFGLRGFRFGLGSFAQALNPLPDTAGGGLGALEALHRNDPRQAVEGGYQALRRPTRYQFGQFFLAGERIERGLGGGGSLLGGGERADCVFGIDCERFHFESPWCRALRGHHMNPSEALESKGLSEDKSASAKD